MLWKTAEHTEEENKRWCWLRACEWGQWPLFVSQPIIPPLLLFAAHNDLCRRYPGWLVVVTGSIPRRTSRPCVFGLYLRRLPQMAVCADLRGVFLWRSEYGLAALSALWPAVTLGLCGLVPCGLIGVFEKKFIAQLLRTPESVLFEESPVDRFHSVANYLTPLLFLAVVCGAWYLWTRMRPAAPFPMPPVANRPPAGDRGPSQASHPGAATDWGVVSPPIRPTTTHGEGIRRSPVTSSASSVRGIRRRRDNP